MKKSVVAFALLLLLASVTFVGFASAQDPGVVAKTDKVLNNILGVLSPVTKLLIGDTGGDSAIFFAKFLLFIIVVSLVWFPIKLFPGIGSNKGLAFIVSLAVGL